MAGLILFVVAYLASGVSESPHAVALHDQMDITAGRNLAAVYQCVVALAAALLCTRIAWRTTFGWSRIVWLAIASGLTMTCVLEFTGLPGSMQSIPLVVALVSMPFVVFMYKHSRHLPDARLLLAILLILLLSNPITDAVERHITSNDDNYTFVAANEPYAFSPDAWTRLQVVSHIQEISEILAIILIVAVSEALLSSPTTESIRQRKSLAGVEHA